MMGKQKADEEALIEMITAGKTMNEIIEITGLNKSTVYRYSKKVPNRNVREYNVYKNYKREEYIDKLTECIEKNMSNNEIAKIFDVTASTVVRWVRENGLMGKRTMYKHERDEAKKTSKQEKEVPKIPEGFNTDRHLCKKCRYRMTGAAKVNLQANCDYIGIEEHSRGCDVETCNKFEKGRKKKAKKKF